MGFRMRKSVNLGGGFRINLSKSGVGYSWGVPGYRITKTAKGNIRKTYSIPGTGLGYVEESKGSKKNLPEKSAPLPTQNPIMEDIESADILSFQSAEYQELIDSITKIIKLNEISNWLCLTLLLFGNEIFLITGIIGVILKIYVRTKGKIKLDYKLDDYFIEKHNKMITSWEGLFKSEQVWQIIQSGKVENRKANGGATSLLSRVNSKMKIDTPFYLKTEQKIVQLILKKETLIFMPDKILIVKGSKIGAINYSDVCIAIENSRFIESEKVPSDATVVGSTWEKVNKNGSPDRRYKGNRQLPICDYGQVNINSKSGLNIVLHSSNLNNAIKFGETIKVAMI